MTTDTALTATGTRKELPRDVLRALAAGKYDTHDDYILVDLGEGRSAHLEPEFVGKLAVELLSQQIDTKIALAGLVVCAIIAVIVALL